jgi:hypothetical protein
MRSKQWQQLSMYLAGAARHPLSGYITAVGVLLLAWGMFVVGNDIASMRMDEDYSWRISQEGAFELVRETALDVHPPGFYLWLAAWMSWAGTDELVILRLASAIPSLLAVAFVYRLGWEWFGSRWVGLGAAVFLATSAVFIHHSGNLRMYPLNALLACASWWFLMRFARGRPGSLWGYAAITGLMAYTHYSLVFIVMAQAVFVLIFWQPRLARLGLALAAAGLAFLPWMPVFIHQLEVTRAQTGRDDLLISGPLAAVPTSVPAVVEFIEIYSAHQPGFTGLLIALALFSGIYARRRTGLAAVLLWFGLTITLFFGVNLLFPIYSLNYVLVVLPGLALLAGMGLYRLPTNSMRLGVVLVIGTVGFFTHTSVFRDSSVPHREMLVTVASRYQPGDKIWYNLDTGARGSSIGSEAAYHLQHDAPQLRPEMFVWDAPQDFVDADRVPRVWDVRPYWIDMPEDAAAVLNSARVVSEHYEFGAYTIQLYEQPPAYRPPVMFSDLLRLIPGGTDRTLYRSGSAVIFKSWWQAEKPPGLDYSYTLHLRRGDAESGILAQVDDGLRSAGDNLPTSAWQPGDPYRLVLHTMALPRGLPRGQYELWLGIYYWEDPIRLPPTTSGSYLLDEALMLVRVAVFRVG